MTSLCVSRFDKKCGKSGIPDNAKCSKKTTAKASSKTETEKYVGRIKIPANGRDPKQFREFERSIKEVKRERKAEERAKRKAKPGPELKERAFAVSSAVQTARAGMALYKGNLTAARRRIQSAGKNAAEYAQERGERTGNKKLLKFATTKNLVEAGVSFNKAMESLQAGKVRGFATNLAEFANTSVEAASFTRQRKGYKLTNFEKRNRQFGDLLQAGKWLSASSKAGSEFVQGRRSARTRGKRLLNASTWGDPLDLRPKNRRRRDSVWAEGFEMDEGPNLSVGRGEKLPVSEGGGLTAKGRAKYNRETGSNLKAPVTGKVKPGSKAAKRRKSFCARSKSWTGERGMAARRRWKC